ncbi:hypothetical protein, partial [Jiella avicenniae]
AQRRNAICKFLRPQTAETGKSQIFADADQSAISVASKFFTGDQLFGPRLRKPGAFRQRACGRRPT